MFVTLIIFLVVLSLLVFVHELGHFVMAKRAGMKVEEFGFGFPPRAFSVHYKGTDYSINWIPLGGFVRIKGESGEHAHDADSFASKSAWKRFLVLIAGVVMNFVTAALLLSIGFMIGLPTVLGGDLPSFARVRDPVIRVLSVLPESPAARAGVKANDVLVSIDGVSAVDLSASHEAIKASADDGVELVVQTQGEEARTVSLQAEDLSEQDLRGVGVGLAATGFVSYGFAQAIVQGTVSSAVYLVEILKAFGGLITSIFVQHEAPADLAGPVGIAVMTGQAARLGLVYLLQFAAILSLNLAVVNVLPFPALDGGRILFLFIEKIRGRAVDTALEAKLHGFGFLLLITLVLFVTFGDVLKYGAPLFGSIKALLSF